MNLYENTKISLLLSSQGVIQIDDWIFKIDKENERVLALHKEHENQINDLLNGNVSNPNIRLFSTEDDILSILEDEARGIFCNQSRIKYKVDNGNYTTPVENNLQCKVSYEPLGIYFQLKSDVEHRAGNLIRKPADLGINYTYRYEGRCNSPSYSENNSYNQCNATTGWCFRYRGDYTIKHYEGIKALKKYFLAATFMVNDNGVSFVIPRYHVIRDGF